MGDIPNRLVVMTGTGTEVGKTWVTCKVIEVLRQRGLSVCVRKPAQSFDEADNNTDAHLLAAASGEDPNQVCPPHRWYERPLAPPIAARALGRPSVRLKDLVSELSWNRCDVGLIETAGGVRSPQADDGDVTDLIAAISPEHVVLVADAGLGTISAVRLCIGALSDVTPSVIVALNRFEHSSDLHLQNMQWLIQQDGYDVVGLTDSGIDILADAVAGKPS